MKTKDKNKKDLVAAEKKGLATAFFNGISHPQKKVSKEAREVIRELEKTLKELDELEKDAKQLALLTDQPLAVFSFIRQLH